MIKLEDLHQNRAAQQLRRSTSDVPSDPSAPFLPPQQPRMRRRRRRANIGYYFQRTILIALSTVLFTTTEGFITLPPRRDGHTQSTTRFFSTTTLSGSGDLSGRSFTRRGGGGNRNKSSRKSLYDLINNVEYSLTLNQDHRNHAIHLLSAARKQLKSNLTEKQKRDISFKVDEALRTILSSAFSPPFNDYKRILSGTEVLHTLATNDYGLSVPYNLIPIKSLLSGITALTSYVKAFAKDNPTMTKEERLIQHRMTDEAYRMLQRLVTGSGLRVRDPFVREAELTRVLDAFCTVGRMDMAKRVVALQDRAPNSPSPSVITYSVLLRGYGNLGNFEQVKRVFAEAKSKGIVVDTVMLNSLIDAYINCDEIVKANTVFRRMKRGEAGAAANLRTYNTMLKGWAEIGRLDQVKRLIEEMQSHDDLWDAVTVNTVVHAAVLKKDWVFAQRFLKKYSFKAENTDRHPFVEAYTELLDGFSEADMVDKALEVYAEMDKLKVKPTEITFCCVLRALGRKGDLSSAGIVIDQMISMGLVPTAKVFGALILGLTNPLPWRDADYEAIHSSRTDNAITVLNRMIDVQCYPPATLIAVVLDFMSRSPKPHLGDAMELVDTLIERDAAHRGDVVLWTALMKYYSTVGNPTTALATFQEIQNPDVAAFNALLDICANSGNQTRVMDVFHGNFQPQGQLAPNIITYSAIFTALLSGPYASKNFVQARKWYNDLKRSDNVIIDKVFVDVVLKLVLRREVIDFLSRSDIYFIAAILNDAESLSWDPGQLERRKRVARGMLARRLKAVFGNEDFLDTLLPPDSDTLFERKGWNRVDSGFNVWGRSTTRPREDRFLKDNGWNSVDSGFRLF